MDKPISITEKLLKEAADLYAKILWSNKTKDVGYSRGVQYAKADFINGAEFILSLSSKQSEQVKDGFEKWLEEHIKVNQGLYQGEGLIHTTKINILKDALREYRSLSPVKETDAVEFAEWIANTEYKAMLVNNEMLWFANTGEKTTSEIYQLFKSESKAEGRENG